MNRVLAAAPDFAPGQAVRDVSCLLLGQAEMVELASQAQAAARAGAPATMRERAFVHALSDWLGGRPSRAAAQIEVIPTLNPRDAPATKMIQAIHFVKGVVSAWDDHPARGYIPGCHNFAPDAPSRAAVLACASGRRVPRTVF